MSERRRRYSIHETRRTTPLIEERQPEIYNSFKQRRRTVVCKTTVHRRHSERVERSPSPIRYRRRRSTPSPPPRLRSSTRHRRRSFTPPQPPQQSSSPQRLANPFTMSPTESPAPGQKFIPLPNPLPTKEEEERARKAKKPTKEKPKVYPKSHKHQQSYDTGYGSSSPYSYEERSPEQYTGSPKSAKPKPDIIPYETIDGKPRTTTYITKDGKVVRYVPRKSSSPINESYGPAKPAEPYKTKYKAAKETTKALQDALYDQAETAQYNYVAAVDQEAKRLSASLQIDALEEELRSLRLKAQIFEDLAETAERKRMVAERKLREQEIEQRLVDQKKERVRREEELARKQWDEIEAMPASPRSISRRPARTPLIEQPSKPRRSSTPTTSPYSSQAMTTATQLPDNLATAGSPFLNPILEAQQEEDRRRATGIQYSSSRRERRRGDDRYS